MQCKAYNVLLCSTRIRLSGSIRLTRSSATAEKQHISYACHSRLAIGLCNSLDTADVVQLD